MEYLKHLPKKVRIVEVGPRDGLQNEKAFVSTEKKIRLIESLADTGLAVIEATAFVHPKWVPQMADSKEVLLGTKLKKGVLYPVLVPNVKGLERALEAGVQEIAVFTAASETFSEKNTNCSIAESLKRIEEVGAKAKKAGLWIRGYVSTCFVCPYEGKIAPEASEKVIQALFQLGVSEVSIGDTIGAATPLQVEVLLSLLQKKGMDFSKLAMHFHDTYGMALANVLLSLEWGVSIFDSSIGGLGGCPYAPGASGNLATEKLLYFLDGLGIETGVDLEKINALSKSLKADLFS